MKSLLDSSILVAALVDAERHHEACLELLSRGRFHVFVHAMAETFSTLTGGRLSYRVLPSIAVESIQVSLLPRVEAVALSGKETLSAIEEAELRGVRGAAIYDYLHLVAARKAGAHRLYTLDLNHFKSFHRAGDPEIVHP